MKKAFTLIELIVVVGIISVVTGFTIASLNSQGSQKLLQGEADKLMNVLSLAQKKAAAGNSTCSSGIFTGYKIVLSTTSYTLQKCCGTEASCTTEMSYNFESPVVLSTSPTNSTGSVLFKRLYAGVLLDNIASQETKNIYIKNPQINGTNQCFMINVHQSGKMYVADQIDTCD